MNKWGREQMRMNQDVPQYCNGKRSYDKKGATTAANHRMQQAHEELFIYACDLGDHWHLTKQGWYNGENRRGDKHKGRG